MLKISLRSEVTVIFSWLDLNANSHLNIKFQKLWKNYKFLNFFIWFLGKKLRRSVNNETKTITNKSFGSWRFCWTFEAWKNFHYSKLAQEIDILAYGVCDNDTLILHFQKESVTKDKLSTGNLFQALKLWMWRLRFTISRKILNRFNFKLRKSGYNLWWLQKCWQFWISSNC